MSALPQSPLPGQAFERHYSVGEVAEMWGFDTQTIRRLFQDEPGVLKISMPRLIGANRKHKPHVHLRIPASVLQRFHEQRAAGFGLKVQRRNRGVE